MTLNLINRRSSRPSPFITPSIVSENVDEKALKIGKATRQKYIQHGQLALLFLCCLSQILPFIWMTPNTSMSQILRRTSHVFKHVRKESIFPRIIHLEKDQGSDKSSIYYPPRNLTSRSHYLKGDENDALEKAKWDYYYNKYESGDDDYYEGGFDESDSKHCKLQHSWQKGSKPNCNLIHEIEMSNYRSLEYVDGGTWRDVWVVQAKQGVQKNDAVLKTQVYEHNFVSDNLDRVRRDAVVMEHLTASPRILNIYSFCGTSSIAEYAPNGSIEQIIWPAGEDDDAPDVTKIPLEFLNLALEVTMGLADLHDSDGNGRPSVAHTDIKPSQYIFTSDGSIKLNDFNRCRFLKWNRRKKKICPYTVGNNPGTNRSPEEYAYGPQTEKVDIYSLGNIYYMLLARLWPFEDDEVSKKDEEIYERIKNGERPPIPPEIQTSTNPIHQILTEAMHQCHQQDPEQRPSAREMVKFLEQKMESIVLVDK